MLTLTVPRALGRRTVGSRFTHSETSTMSPCGPSRLHARSGLRRPRAVPFRALLAFCNRQFIATGACSLGPAATARDLLLRRAVLRSRRRRPQGCHRLCWARLAANVPSLVSHLSLQAVRPLLLAPVTSARQSVSSQAHRRECCDWPRDPRDHGLHGLWSHRWASVRRIMAVAQPARDATVREGCG